MKRDMDLVREILREIAASDCGLDAAALATDARPFELVAYHMEIMGEAGLIRAKIARGWGGAVVSARAEALTWEGNDFLSAVSSDRVWSAVKLRVGRALGEASIETVKALAVKVATDFLLG